MWKQGATAQPQGSVSSSPRLHTSWLFNSSELFTSGKYEISLNYSVTTLDIQDVMLSDSGNYTCEVLNELASEICKHEGHS